MTVSTVLGLLLVAVAIIVIAAITRAVEARRTKDQPPPQRVVFTDIQMPFSSMVTFMVKWALASIPAAIILGLLVVFVLALAGTLGPYSSF